MKYKMLVVDDEPANVRLVDRLFRGNFEVLGASSGPEALEILAVHDVAVIISDQRMPGMTGIEFLKRAAEMRPRSVRIIITGYTDVNALVEAINSGVVYKYVTKPWENSDLAQTVDRAVDHYEAMRSEHQLNSENSRLKQRLDVAHRRFLTVLQQLLAETDIHDGRTLEMVHELAVKIAQDLNFEDEELRQLSLAVFISAAARYRLSGYLRIDRDGMSAEDRALVKEKREWALQLLDGEFEFEEAAAAARFIPENFDGSGFDGLVGEQIPLLSQVIAVALEYCEMTVGEEAVDGTTASHQISARSGLWFDPLVVTAFNRVMESPANRPEMRMPNNDAVGILN